MEYYREFGKIETRSKKIKICQKVKAPFRTRRFNLLQHIGNKNEKK